MSRSLNSYICANCGKEFTLAPALRAKYPKWTPKQCEDCHGGRRPRSSGKPALDRTETLKIHLAGPQTGIFTDGFCEPNPGRGGWGAVRVSDGGIREERSGREDNTTNNRMEMTAVIAAYKMLPAEDELPIYSDSELCVNIITQWAKNWSAKGWKKKGGEIKNLDLVKEAYALAQAHLKVKLTWIKGHAGQRWNEYADALAREAASGPPSNVSLKSGTNNQ